MKKGFTLIELLAVIVILGIIAVITTPLIMGVIEDARKSAALSSAQGYVEAVEQSIMESELDLEGENLSDGTYEIEKLINIEYKGKGPTKGYVRVRDMEVISAGLCMNDYSIYYNGIKTEESEKSYCKEGYEGPSKIYGVRRKIEESTTAWERIEDSVELEANAIKEQNDLTTGVQNDFDSLYPWSEIESYTYDVKKKEITSWYNDNPQTFDFDGSNGEVLTYIPTFYYKRYQEDGYEYILISNKNLEGYTRSDAFSIGRYTMSGDDNAVHSKSGVQPLTNKTISNFREYARKLGKEFSQLDYHYFIIQLLYLVEYADYDSQTKLGKGYTDTNNGAAKTSGECNSLGMKSGTLNDDGKHSMIYRGIEDIYGNVWQYVDGVNIKNNKAYVCYDPDQYESDTFAGCYKELGYINADVTGYITKLGYDKNNPLIVLPIVANGSNSTHIPDYYWQNSGNRIARVGGTWNYGSQTGLWCWSGSMASQETYGHSGARLLITH